MIKMRYSLVACAVLGLFVAMPASATSMRCSGQIIQAGTIDGPGKYEVLKKCGEPTERIGNTWVYDRPGQPKRTLRFNTEGTLVRVE